ncbi:MAG TPA: type II toxin-antitoxin system YafQ family toxin [Phycisphaerae bacterium]|nr:type II toxin-antitoxin system YafQ family toxin [Phycisphaerae bacterium]
MKLTRTNQFKKDYKRAKKQRKDLTLLKGIIQKLTTRERLSPKHNDHRLAGALSSFRELHIQPDWLLIYQAQHNHLVLVRLGSHSELFKA